jgi:hypothetical protein
MTESHSIPRGVAQHWVHFVAAGRMHAIDPFLLAAVCLRESGGGVFLSTGGPDGTGDAGHGHGLMQIDDRAHGDWLKELEADGSPKWADPAENIAKGAEILKAALVAFHGDIHLAACAYNAGAHAVRHAISKLGPSPTPDAEWAAADAITTGHNYGSWVAEKYLLWRGAA